MRLKSGCRLAWGFESPPPYQNIYEKTFMKLKQVTIPLYMVYDKDGHPILVDNLAKYDNEEVDVVTEDDWDDEGNNCGVSYGYLK